MKDYFAELFVAGLLADAGWNFYFSLRDQGFVFNITKRFSEQLLIRPVQVKGKYPMEGTRDRQSYGYIGKLELHPEMVLAIPFFPGPQNSPICNPVHVAYLPLNMIKKHQRGFRCLPAVLRNGKPHPKRDYK